VHVEFVNFTVALSSDLSAMRCATNCCRSLLLSERGRRPVHCAYRQLAASAVANDDRDIDVLGDDETDVVSDDDDGSDALHEPGYAAPCA